MKDRTVNIPLTVRRSKNAIVHDNNNCGRKDSQRMPLYLFLTTRAWHLSLSLLAVNLSLTCFGMCAASTRWNKGDSLQWGTAAGKIERTCVRFTATWITHWRARAFGEEAERAGVRFHRSVIGSMFDKARALTHVRRFASAIGLTSNFLGKKSHDHVEIASGFRNVRFALESRRKTVPSRVAVRQAWITRSSRAEILRRVGERWRSGAITTSIDRAEWLATKSHADRE